MSAKTFLQVVGIIFSLVGGVHLLRLLAGWDIVIGGWMVPMWVSLLGVILPWYLAYNAFTLAKKKYKK